MGLGCYRRGWLKATPAGRPSSQLTEGHPCDLGWLHCACLEAVVIICSARECEVFTRSGVRAFGAGQRFLTTAMEVEGRVMRGSGTESLSRDGGTVRRTAGAVQGLAALHVRAQCSPSRLASLAELRPVCPLWLRMKPSLRMKPLPPSAQPAKVAVGRKAPV